MTRYTWVEDKTQKITLEDFIETMLDSIEHNLGIDFRLLLYKRGSYRLGIPTDDLELIVIRELLP
jgi:hypothetical protein